MTNYERMHCMNETEFAEMLTALMNNDFVKSGYVNMQAYMHSENSDPMYSMPLNDKRMYDGRTVCVLGTFSKTPFLTVTVLDEQEKRLFNVPDAKLVSKET